MGMTWQPEDAGVCTEGLGLGLELVTYMSSCSEPWSQRGLETSLCLAGRAGEGNSAGPWSVLTTGHRERPRWSCTLPEVLKALGRGLVLSGPPPSSPSFASGKIFGIRHFQGQFSHLN